MTVDWIKQTFPPFMDDVLVYEDNDTFTSCNPEWLASQEPTSNPPTYAELFALQIVEQGWQKVFDQWKEKGIAV